MIPITYYLYISVALFVIGMMIVLIRKNAIVILMGMGKLPEKKQGQINQ